MGWFTFILGFVVGGIVGFATAIILVKIVMMRIKKNIEAQLIKKVGKNLTKKKGR